MRKKLKYRLRMLHSLKPYAFGAKKFLLLNLLTGLFAMVLAFALPLFYRLFIDRVILNGEMLLIPAVAAGYLSVFFASLALQYLKNYCTNRLVNRVTFRVRMKILGGYLRRDFASYDRQGTGDMKMRIDDDTACIAAYADAQTADYVIAYATLIISVALLFFLEWRLAAFSCIAIPLTFWFDYIIAKREKAALNNIRENDQAMSGWFHASVQGWKEIKALNLQERERLRFSFYIKKYAAHFGTWINYWTARAWIIPKIKDEFLMQFSLYFLGGLLIINGRLGIGSLLVFMQYYGILAKSLKTVSDTDAELITNMPKSDRLLEELSAAAKPRRSGKVPETGNTIEFRDVSFSYGNTGKDVISGLSFTIKNGERVAIASKSGEGKTTVLKLIAGMLKPTNGTVLFLGTDVSAVTENVLYKKIGFVMQENVLFNATIRENLLYAKSNATYAEIKSACRKAFIYDFIESLPAGFDTVIGERGIKLSGGQKQRVVLARLFLRDSDIFIFDEATSALDQYSESIILDAIKSIGRDKTIIVATHRESSLALCGRVITLKEKG